MIANARMYAVSPRVASLWDSLLSAIIAASGVPVAVIEHAAPKPLDELWRRSDMGAVFMCGLPFSRSRPQPVLVAAPVPSLAEFGGEPRYWSEFVVRNDSGYRSVADTFGARIAFTVPESQSGCVAALDHLQSIAPGGHLPLYAEVIAPTVTPLGALTAVIDGTAEIAPIDVFALRLLEAYRPELTARVRVVGRTLPTPIPPLVASGPAPAALSAAFQAAHSSQPTMSLMRQLLLERFVRPDSSAYGVLSSRYAATTEFWRSHRLAHATHPAFAW